jgi:hypothetical protein
VATRVGSLEWPAPNEIAAPRASQCSGSSWGISPRKGPRSWLSVAKLTSTSNSAPPARTTWYPRSSALATAASSRAVLPTPGSPDIRSDPPPATASSRKLRSVCSSTGRPTNALTGSVRCGCVPLSGRGAPGPGPVEGAGLCPSSRWVIDASRCSSPLTRWSQSRAAQCPRLEGSGFFRDALPTRAAPFGTVQHDTAIRAKRVADPLAEPSGKPKRLLSLPLWNGSTQRHPVWPRAGEGAGRDRLLAART